MRDDRPFSYLTVYTNQGLYSSCPFMTEITFVKRNSGTFKTLLLRALKNQMLLTMSIGFVSLKCKVFHHLLTPILFQTCMTFLSVEYKQKICADFSIPCNFKLQNGQKRAIKNVILFVCVCVCTGSTEETKTVYNNMRVNK